MTDLDLASSLNPRDVLAYLNEMGIRNVSGEMLKEFICDLKKLIRYDLQTKKNDEENIPRRECQQPPKGPERLHSCSTVSSRSKIVNPKQIRKPLSNLPDSNTNPQSDAGRSNYCCKKVLNKNQPPVKRIVKSATISPESKTLKSNKPITRSSNFIKIAIPEKPKRSDPVSLYHYYNSMWEKYKTSLPGENDWGDIRWSIREKLLGAPQQKSNPKGIQTKEILAKRREGWST